MCLLIVACYSYHVLVCIVAVVSLSRACCFLFVVVVCLFVLLFVAFFVLSLGIVVGVFFSLLC